MFPQSKYTCVFILSIPRLKQVLSGSRFDLFMVTVVINLTLRLQRVISTIKKSHQKETYRKQEEQQSWAAAEAFFVFCPFYFCVHLSRCVSMHPNSFGFISKLLWAFQCVRYARVPNVNTSEHLLFGSSLFSICAGSKDWKQ